MDVLQLIFDNRSIVFEGLGYITGVVGVTLPFLKPSNTIKIGKLVGKILKIVFRQKDQYAGLTKRYAGTLAQFSKGLLQGLQ